MVDQQLLEHVRIDGVGRRGEELDGVIPELGSFADAGREIVPKHERSAACFVDETNGDCGANHGGRWRVMSGE